MKLWVTIGMFMISGGFVFSQTESSKPVILSGQTERNSADELIQLKTRIDQKRASFSKEDLNRLDQQIGRLASYSEKTRDEAIRLLSTSADRLALPLAPYLKAKNNRLRMAACQVLVGATSLAGLEEVEPLFYELLRMKESDSRRCALQAYFRLPIAPALDRIIQNLDTPEEEVQDLALMVLGRLPVDQLRKIEPRLKEFVKKSSANPQCYWIAQRAKSLLDKTN